MSLHPPIAPSHPTPRWARSNVLALCFAAGILTLGFAPLARPAEANHPIDLALYAGLLESHTRAVPDVVGTRVDYAALRDSADWKRLARQVREATPSKLNREERLAFWINAYNILTIDLILDHYPVASIRDIGSFFFPVWDKPVATIEEREVSLGFIEHEILRKMGEPRIHAAIVCASTSCPPLARTPYRPESIDRELSAAMTTWLASPKKGIAIDRDQKQIRLSAIFKWFGEDFEAAGGVLSSVAPFVSPEDASWLKEHGDSASVRYFDYDWTLNDLR
jgi:hypothetical protein